MSILPGAEPFFHHGGPVGAVLSHGFTGCPQSMRPWAEHLAAAGLTIALPLLPGHGRTWQELGTTTWTEWYAEVDRAFTDLQRVGCHTIFAMGLSMGGALALRLAQVHGTGVHGLVLVNPSVLMTRTQHASVAALRPLPRSLPGIASDIKKPGVTELAYDRVPLTAARSLARLHKAVRTDMAAIMQPILLYRSTVDRVVPAASSAYVVKNARSTDLEEIVLTDSFHVATLDNDAPKIFAGSLDFVDRVSAAAPEARED